VPAVTTASVGQVGELPSQVGSNLQQADSAQRGVLAARESINRDRERRLLLEKQLGDLQTPTFVEEAPSSTRSGTVDTSGPTQQQLAQAQAQVASLEAKGLKPGHPDLDSAKRRVRTWPAGEDDGLARSKIARAQRPQGVECRSHFPLLGSLGRARKCLRTTQMVYAMIERGLLPGVTRIGRRLLVRSTDLLDFLDHKRTPSPQEYRR